MTGRKPRSRWRMVAATLVLALSVGYAVVAPGRANETFVDQVISRQTTEHMRAGAGYYPSMDRALRANNGAASSVRAFREPTIFLLWRLLPSQSFVWWAFFAMVA